MRFPLYAAGAAIGALLVVSPMPTGAAPLAGAMSKDFLMQTDGNSLVIQVQRRRGGRAFRGRAFRGGGHRGGGGNGGAVAAGVLGGLLLGAIIASEAQRHEGVEYCIQNFRSYNPDTGFYLGFDGRYHRCP